MCEHCKRKYTKEELYCVPHNGPEDLDNYERAKESLRAQRERQHEESMAKCAAAANPPPWYAEMMRGIAAGHVDWEKCDELAVQETRETFARNNPEYRKIYEALLESGEPLSESVVFDDIPYNDLEVKKDVK